VLTSLAKTGRVVVADTSWVSFGVASEVASVCADEGFRHLRAPVRRIGLADCPAPVSLSLERAFYPDFRTITRECLAVLDRDPELRELESVRRLRLHGALLMGRDVSLSVLIPAFNEEKHLEHTVDAVREAAGSAVPNLEILIVDDGSSDATADIARKLEKDDPRVRLLVNPVNVGLGASYKRGLYERSRRTLSISQATTRGRPRRWPRSSGASVAPTSSRRTRPIRRSELGYAASSRRSTPGW
jgi:hypothetical protein